MGNGGLEIVDEEVVVPVAAPANPEAGLAPAVPAAPTEAGAPAAAHTDTAALLPSPERPLRRPEPARVVSAEAEPAASPAESRGLVTAVAVPATPATPTLAEPRAAVTLATAATATARDEAPPVRVHIGRLEVRANLHEPSRAQPPAEAREPEGLSLSDYLRGKRGA
jgi:hypothetical protein